MGLVHCSLFDLLTFDFEIMTFDFEILYGPAEGYSVSTLFF